MTRALLCVYVKTKKHHLPTWFKKLVRTAASDLGLDTGTSDDFILVRGIENELGVRVFDHWGSMVLDGKRVVFTMPYGEHDDAVAKLAGVIGCWAGNFGMGSHHPDTTLYIFSEDALVNWYGQPHTSRSTT